MTEFTASNAYQVDPASRTALNRVRTKRTLPLSPNAWDALREYFQHEQDEKLGRWRWPEDPTWVVYPLRGSVGDFVRVLNEATGYSGETKRPAEGKFTKPTNQMTTQWRKAARAYFEAHPERPQPWRDAKPGEVWILLVKGAELAAVREFGGDFKLSSGNLLAPSDERITAGRRIWPETKEKS